MASQNIPFYRAQNFHQKYLIISAIIIAAFAPLFFLGTMPQYAEPIRWSLDLLSWPIDGKQVYTEPTTRFVSALTGGFLLGWGVTIWFLARNVYVKAPEEVRKAVLFGIISWFVLDSAGSALSGNTSNVLFNVLILLVGTGPLWFKSAKN